MQASVAIKRKLATLIGTLIERCIREARLIPHVLSREEVINLLVANPMLFEKLVHDEHTGNTALSKEDLTVRVDVARELEKLDNLGGSEASSFWEGPEADLSSILDLTNQLTRTFAVYLGNAATLFDRAFEDFMNKFRQSLQKAGMTLRTVDFSLDDASIFEETAVSYLAESEFLQAFTFDRLLSSQIMMKQVVNLPAEGFSLRENLVRHAMSDEKLASAMVKFAIRISYISQGGWDDLLRIVVRQAYEGTGACDPAMVLDLIERDVVFACNLLCRSYAEIRELPAAQRRSALEGGLRNYRDRAAALEVTSPNL